MGKINDLLSGVCPLPKRWTKNDTVKGNRIIQYFMHKTVVKTLIKFNFHSSHLIWFHCWLAPAQMFAVSTLVTIMWRLIEKQTFSCRLCKTYSFYKGYGDGVVNFLKKETFKILNKHTTPICTCHNQCDLDYDNLSDYIDLCKAELGDVSSSERGCWAVLVSMEHQHVWSKVQSVYQSYFHPFLISSFPQWTSQSSV